MAAMSGLDDDVDVNGDVGARRCSMKIDDERCQLRCEAMKQSW